LRTGPYTYAGGRPLWLAPGPALRAGLCAVALRSTGPLDALAGLPRVLARGPAGGSGPGLSGRGVHLWPAAASVLVESDRLFPVQVDGEPLLPRRSLEVRLLPDALDLVVPLLGTVAVPGGRGAGRPPPLVGRPPNGPPSDGRRGAS
jgi:hypothetical protein